MEIALFLQSSSRAIEMWPAEVRRQARGHPRWKWTSLANICLARLTIQVEHLREKYQGIISDHVNITCYKGRGNDEEEVLQAGPH